MAAVAKELVNKLKQYADKGDPGLPDLVASLREHSFQLQDIKDSGLSKVVGKLRKHENDRVKVEATTTVDLWTKLFKVHAKPPKPDSEPPLPDPEAAAQPGPSAPVAEVKGDGYGVPTFTGPDAPTRTSAFTKFREIFERVVRQAADYKLSEDELQGVDAVALAAQLEESMYRELGAGTPYKNKLRSLLFNLKDAKNTTLVTRVMCGSITPEGLVTMNPKDMASDATKDWRKKVAEYKKMELMDQQSYQRYAHGDREQPDGLFECPKCKSQKTEYTEKQTRSADEPTTKFCHCISCEYRWKFC